MIFSKKSVTYLTLMFAVTALGSVYAKSSKKERHNSLVGSYAVDVTNLGFFGVYSFQEGGTLTWHDSASLEQPIPPLFPAGALATVGVGRWKEICKRSYKIVHASVINTRDLTTRNSCGDLLLAGIPFTRLKVEGTLELSDDCQFINGTLVLNFFQVDDISLTKPLLIEGQPIPPITATFIGQRIDFSDVN